MASVIGVGVEVLDLFEMRVQCTCFGCQFGHVLFSASPDGLRIKYGMRLLVESVAAVGPVKQFLESVIQLKGGLMHIGTARRLRYVRGLLWKASGHVSG